MWHYYGGFAGDDAGAVMFINAYGEYADVAQRADALTHAPTVEENTSRSDLYASLAAMLTEAQADDVREVRARAAFAQLDQLKREVDAAQAAQADLLAAQEAMGEAARALKSARLRVRAQEIVEAAGVRSAVSAKITGLLSHANDESYAIITRVLEEKGALSQEHIIRINSITTAAETRHDELTAAYDELVRAEELIQSSFAAFVAEAL